MDYNKDILESSLEFTHQNEDLYLSFNSSMYETLKENYNDKYEYILPEIILEKNLLSNDNFGILNLQSNLKFHNYDTNKSKKILINDFDWTSNTKSFATGINTNLLGNLKNLNYEAKNISPFKEDTTSEFYGAIGLLSELNLFKNNNNSKHFLQPKMLLRFAPGSMRTKVVAKY